MKNSPDTSNDKFIVFWFVLIVVVLVSVSTALIWRNGALKEAEKQRQYDELSERIQNIGNRTP